MLLLVQGSPKSDAKICSCSVGPGQVSHYGERQDLLMEGAQARVRYRVDYMLMRVGQVKEGDKFSAGDVLLTVETDKGRTGLTLSKHCYLCD